MIEQQSSDAKAEALRIVERMAYDYVDNLLPGDCYPLFQEEARKHFDVGSQGYGLFIKYALQRRARYVMDVDADRRIVSIVMVKY